MQKRNLVLRGLSPVSIEENRRSVCLNACSRRCEAELSVSPEELVLKTDAVIRLTPAEISHIRINNVKPPMWPYITAAIAVAASVIPFTPGAAASWIILALGLLIAVVHYTRGERLSVEIKTVWGSRITICFRCGCIDENRLRHTVSTMHNLLFGKNHKKGGR